MRRAFDTVLLIATALVVWHGLHMIAPTALTSPAQTVARAVEMLKTPTFWPHVVETLTAFGYSLLFAFGGGRVQRSPTPSSFRFIRCRKSRFILSFC